MAFVNDFLKSLAIPIGDLAKWLEEEHQIPVVDTITKWNELTGMLVVVDNDSVICEKVEDQTINIGKKKKVQKNLNTCQHVFIAGNRKGQQCSIKPKGGASYCSAHKIKAKKGGDLISDDNEPPEIKSPRRGKKIKSKEFVDDIDSDNETTKNNNCDTIKPKIPLSDPESDFEDKKPALKKRVKKKIPPKGSDSDSDSDSN
jgi:hypothetical protein